MTTACIVLTRETSSDRITIGILHRSVCILFLKIANDRNFAVGVWFRRRVRLNRTAFSFTKNAGRRSVCPQTARVSHRHNRRGESASRTTWPSIGLTATARTVPGTVRRCRRLANTWTGIRAPTVSVSVVSYPKSYHRLTTRPCRRAHTTRRRAGRPLAAGPRPAIASHRHGSPPTTDTITPSPTTSPR